MAEKSSSEPLRGALAANQASISARNTARSASVGAVMTAVPTRQRSAARGRASKGSRLDFGRAQHDDMDILEGFGFKAIAPTSGRAQRSLRGIRARPHR